MPVRRRFRRWLWGTCHGNRWRCQTSREVLPAPFDAAYNRRELHSTKKESRSWLSIVSRYVNRVLMQPHWQKEADLVDFASPWHRSWAWFPRS